MSNSVVEKLFEFADQIPNKKAIITSKGDISYSELCNAVKTFSQMLKDRDVQKGDYVILKASHSIDFAIAYFACNLNGSVVVPIESNLPLDGILEIKQKISAKALIVKEEEKQDDVVSFNYLSIYDECIDRNVDNYVLEFPPKEQLSELLFTTGTTGKSKGVELTNKAIIAVLENIIHETKISKTNVALIPMPLNHVFGLRRFQANLFNGSTVVLRDGLVPIKSFFNDIEEHMVTSLSLVPAAISYMFTASKDYIRKYEDQLVYVESSSAPLSQENRNKLRECLPKTSLYNFYGCTESTAACVLEYSKYPDMKYCVGKPCIHSNIQLIDTDGKKVERVQEEGRIVISSSANMLGYWGDKQETDKTLINNYLYTNDMGYWNEEGFLCVLGRMDDVINIGGNKIAPDEIENIIMTDVEISDCVCIGETNKAGENILKLYVVTQLDEKDIKLRIINLLRDKVEAYKIPSVITKINKVPRTFNGKIQRNKLRELV